MTPSAGAGPEFVRVTVKLIADPTKGVGFETVFRSERSACAETVRLAVAGFTLVPAFVLVRSEDVFA